MRRLAPGEAPVLPVGHQNFRTGQNKDFTVDMNEQRTMSLINLSRNNKTRQAVMLSGQTRERGSFAHDQTHREIGQFQRVATFTGPTRDIFNQIQQRTGKRSLPAFVFK